MNPIVVAIRVDGEELNAIIASLPKRGECDPDNPPPLARVGLKIIAASIAEPGTCMVCECTNTQACPGGCAWVNGAQTLCDACLP